MDIGPASDKQFRAVVYQTPLTAQLHVTSLGISAETGEDREEELKFLALPSFICVWRGPLRP